MKRLIPLLLLLACTSTPEKPEGEKPETPSGTAGPKPDEITIPPDDLEPMNEFIFNTRRIVAAEFIRVETTAQYFEEKIAFTRDFRFVKRESSVLADGTRVVRLINENTDQLTNIDPELLPRVFFGQGLELRAFREIRLHLKPSRSRERPLYVEVQCRSSADNVRLWVNGRLEKEQPKLIIFSELLWSEDRERYIHRAAAE
jgi:hypothetical protein